MNVFVFIDSWQVENVIIKVIDRKGDTFLNVNRDEIIFIDDKNLIQIRFIDKIIHRLQNSGDTLKSGNLVIYNKGCPPFYIGIVNISQEVYEYCPHVFVDKSGIKFHNKLLAIYSSTLKEPLNSNMEQYLTNDIIRNTECENKIEALKDLVVQLKKDN